MDPTLLSDSVIAHAPPTAVDQALHTLAGRIEAIPKMNVWSKIAAEVSPPSASHLGYFEADAPILLGGMLESAMWGRRFHVLGQERKALGRSAFDHLEVELRVLGIWQDAVAFRRLVPTTPSGADDQGNPSGDMQTVWMGYGIYDAVDASPSGGGDQEGQLVNSFVAVPPDADVKVRDEVTVMGKLWTVTDVVDARIHLRVAIRRLA